MEVKFANKHQAHILLLSLPVAVALVSLSFYLRQHYAGGLQVLTRASTDSYVQISANTGNARLGKDAPPPATPELDTFGRHAGASLFDKSFLEIE